MKRQMPRRAVLYSMGICVALSCLHRGATANDITWAAAVSGNWEIGANWNGGFTPNNFDSANFNLAGTYNVTFGVAPASIQRLIVGAGTVTFQSSGGVKSLNLDAPGGNNSVFVLGPTTTMNLGGASANPMTLFVPQALIVGTGGSFVARSASTVNTLGPLQVGQIVNGNITASISNFTIQSAATMSLGGNLTIANQNVPGVFGNLTVTGANSTLTQYQDTSVTVGSVSNGGGNLTITNTGLMNTGTGLFTINNTGAVTVNTNSTLNVNGDIFINGGVFSSAGTFNWANGQFWTIDNGGFATFSTDYTTPSNAVINVNGFTSLLQTTGTGSDLFIAGGSTINIGQQGSAAISGIVTVGSGTNGFLNVDGIDASFAAGSTTLPSVFGTLGGIADVRFSNQATGFFNLGINLATGTLVNPGAIAFLTVESGADLIGLGNVGLANSNSVATTATMTITDLGSTMTLANSRTLTIGQAVVGEATINVNNQGLLSLGTLGTTTLNATGTININGGIVNLQTLVNNGGTINFNSGSLSYLGNLTIGTGGLLGTNLTLTDEHELALSGTTTLNAGSFFLIESGAGYFTGTLANNGQFILNGVNPIANATTVNNAGLIRGNGAIVVTTSFNNNAGGELRAEDGKRILIQGPNGTNSGVINLLGGTAEFSQPLTNGAIGLISGRGNLIVKPTTPAGTALTNNGNIAFSSGITGVFGDVVNNTGSATVGITITGNSNVTFWDDVNNVAPSLFKVTPGSSVTIFGAFSGAGITGGGQMNFDGDLAPGSSPAAIALDGNVTFATTTRLKIELGGTTAGTQHDQVNVTGLLTLDGTLQVSLINGFVPQLGDTFQILTWGSLVGTFATLEFPTVAGRGFSTGQLYTTGLLPIFSTLYGDFDQDGHVNAADIAAMLAALTDLSAYKSSRNLSDADLLAFGDINNSGAVNNADLQGLINLLISGGGSTTPVPEPASAILLGLALPMLALATRCTYRRRAG